MIAESASIIQVKAAAAILRNDLCYRQLYVLRGGYTINH